MTEIKKDTVDYRDPTPFDDSKLQTIEAISDAIRHKQKGVSVREAIAQQGERLVRMMAESGTVPDAEIAAARGIFNTLGAREVAQENAIRDNKTTIDAKAGKDYVDSVLSTVASGGPRELFYSISALKSKYPNGQDGTYLVIDTTFNDGAHTFVYDDSAKTWKDLGAYGTSEQTMQKLINDSSAYVEQTDRSTIAELRNITGVGDASRWTFSYQYRAGYIKGAWLKIISDEDQDWEVTLISAKDYRVLYTVTGTGHGTVVVPVNKFIRDKFMVSIVCDKFGFNVEQNGNRFSKDRFDDVSVGTQLSFEWDKNTTSYNLGIEMLYYSIDNAVLDMMQKFNAGVPYARRAPTTRDFNDCKEPGGYWLEKLQGETNIVDLVNAPGGAAFGSFYVNVTRFDNYYGNGQYIFLHQLAQTYDSEIGKGVYSRFLVLNNYTLEVEPGNEAIETWVRLDNVEPPKPTLEMKKMFVAGDSITAGHPYEDVAGIHWWESVAKTLKYDVTVGAKNGSGYLYLNGGKNAITIVDSTDFSQFDIAVLAFGTNDYGNNIDLGQLGDMYPTNQTLYGAIDYVVNKIYTSNPEITLILSTPINRATHGTASTKFGYGTNNDQGYNLSQVCDAIIDVCDKYGIAFIDNRNSPFNLFTVNSLLVDKLHPTQQGYKVLGAHLASAIGAITRPFIAKEA